MKKLLSLLLILCFLIPANAMALNYKAHLPNEATFETIEEAHVNGPDWLSEVTGRKYVPDPAMDDYPIGTTWVYRAPGMYTCLSAALRMNTNFLVYTDKAFETKEDAYAYIEGIGLVNLVNACYGSIVLVTPIDKEAGFGDADQMAFYRLQSAMCNLTFSTGGRGDPNAAYYADNSYYGGLTYRYAIGVDGGATFLNNYVASEFDYVGRMAGMLLVNGKMESIREVAAPVPVYLVNPGAGVAEKYRVANGTTAWGYNGGVDFYFNQELPLQKVYVNQEEEIDLKALVSKVYDDMFEHALRIPVVNAGLYTPATPYRNYNWNQAPYSLGERVPFYTGKTPGGLCFEEHTEDRFSDICTDTGEYLQTWYEVMPEEVLNGTAAPSTIPLILANHGGGDDVMQFLDETGLLPIAEAERIAIVAGYHSNITRIVDKAMPALVRYMLDTYPALDASRVYVTGYSAGGVGTMNSTYGAPELFAASCPMAVPFHYATEEELANIAQYDIPFLITTSTYDAFYDRSYDGVAERYTGFINDFLGYNEMEKIEFNFETYPISGFMGDVYTRTVLNGEYANHNWLILNNAGVPMVSLNVTEDLPHGLYQEYGKVVWNFMKHYARNPETHEVLYNPYGY